MIAAHRSLGLLAACTVLLCGCGSSSYSTQYGSAVAAATPASGSAAGTSAGHGFGSESGGLDGTHDSIVATPPSPVVSVEVGTTKTISVTLTSSDGRAISGFALSDANGAQLPAEWSAPATFGCRSLSTGSGCVLNLRFAPTAYEIDQALTLHYVFVDNAQEPVTSDSMTILYQATTNDNVAPLLAPAGQINATVDAGAQIVTASFTTDDGHPASGFAITSDPASLPSGWTAPAASTCDTVSAGTACELSWTFTPVAPGNGTLTIDYSFDDDSGTPKTASFNIPYAATANDNVVAAAAPAGPICVSSGSAATVLLTFTTDDGFEASNLSMDTSSLPAGWSAASGRFTCTTISAGMPCQLALRYAPAAAGANDTLQLQYAYADNAAVAKTGSVNIAYTST